MDLIKMKIEKENYTIDIILIVILFSLCIALFVNLVFEYPKTMCILTMLYSVYVYNHHSRNIH